MSDSGYSKPRGNFVVGAVAGILLGLLVVWLAFVVVRPGETTTATPAASQSAKQPKGTASDTGEPPSMSPGQSEDPSSASPSATPGAEVVTKLKSGTRIAVLASLPKSRYSAADAADMAASLARGEWKPSVVDTNKIPGLTAGYYAVAVVDLADYDAVKKACAGLGRVAGTDRCYSRTIR